MFKASQNYTYEALIKLDHDELLKLIELHSSDLVTQNIETSLCRLIIICPPT